MQNLINKDSAQLDEMANEKRVQKLIDTVEKEFSARQKERLSLERQWELNMNFLNGNQYCDINSRGELVSDGKTYFWQGREVYNHIAPLIESRMAKFSRIAPTVYVRPQSDDDKDIAAATLAEKVISESFKKNELEGVIKTVTAWSETCGTGFYKIVWDNKAGNQIGQVGGEVVYEGDVRIYPISPFEIFPDNLFCENLEDCSSVIHAKAMTVSKVREKYGVLLSGEEVGVYNLSSTGAKSSKKTAQTVIKDAVVVIEMYEKKSDEYPDGRLVTVAGGKLLYEGVLPYVNGENGERGFPFVKQTSLSTAGSFFGVSIVERLIPVQRAYNAVKNRKHEFLNRLSMGVMTVEDGSVDLDDLEEDGLSPGKILVYRQGAKAPELMQDTSMPDDFNAEEEKLLNEFVVVSGVSDVSSSSTNANIKSGSALEILVEQDNSRLLSSAENIRKSYLDISRQVIRLYAQFTAGLRAIKGQDEGGKIQIYYADERAVGSDDVYLEGENELLYTHSQKKEMVFKLYESGLLSDEEGNLRAITKEKILSLLGYKDLDYRKGMAKLQEEKAQRENEEMLKGEIEVEEIDDNAIHVDEHTRFVLCEYESLTEKQKQTFFAHIRAHKQIIVNNNNGEN